MAHDLSTIDGFLAARADWKAQGCPTDHPYITAERVQPSVQAPLAVDVTPDQWALVQAQAAASRAQSDANVRAMMRRGR